MKEGKKITKKITVEPKLKSELHIEQDIDDGYYHLISVDSKGNEIPGTEFRVSPRTYNRSYAHNPKFLVKKKP